MTADIDIDARFRSAGLYMSYMNYHATGEGVRSCISVAGSAGYSVEKLKARIPKYFHQGIVTTAIDSSMDPDAIQMIAWIPGPLKSALIKMPRGAAEYYSEYYYNLS